MSWILAQPIYRDALLFGKFLAGLTTLAMTLAALWLFVIGLGILLLGLPPSSEEVVRGFAFLIVAVAYGGVWLALALLFSVVFRSAATAALAALGGVAAVCFLLDDAGVARRARHRPAGPGQHRLAAHSANVAEDLSRLSPNTLFAETTLAILDPSTRALGLILSSQLEGAVSAPLPFVESLALIWPQMTGLIGGFIVLFTIAYVAFQRQEVRA